MIVHHKNTTGLVKFLPFQSFKFPSTLLFKFNFQVCNDGA